MDYITYLMQQVDRAIYVRGAQGENLLAMTDAHGWIRTMETTRRSDYAQHTAEYDRNAERAIALYEQRKSAGVSPLRAFDCSGLTMYYAEEYELVDKDHNASGIYRKLCAAIPAPATVRGQLVFKSSDGKPLNIYHMATYVGNGQLIESRGRDYGVVMRAYNPDEWTHVGEWPELMACCAEPHKLTSADNGEGLLALQRALNLLGYTDEDTHPLEEDGKLGGRTRSALEELIRYNLPELKITLTPAGPVWARVEK